MARINKTEMDNSVPMMRLYMKNSNSYITCNTLLCELLNQELAVNAALRWNLNGEPYISFGTADRYKTEGEMEARGGYPLIIMKSSRQLGFTRKKLLLAILDEYELGHNVIKADIYLLLKDRANTDRDAVLDFAINRVKVLEEDETAKSEPEDVLATDVETQNIASLPAPEPEPKPVPTPANDIRYARLKIECADNGFLLRDDVGNCWVADVSPDDLGKEIGREIYGEIDEAEKAIMGTDEWKLGSMTIWGWSVVVAVKAITDPRELHEFKDREI